MTNLIDMCVLVCVAVVGYAWVGYPLLLRLVAGRRSVVQSAADPEWPRIAVLLSAHNEEAVMGDRLQNLLGGDYPSDRLHVRVGIDGGTDGTVRVAREIADRDARVTVHAFDDNRGKVAVLKDLVAAEDAAEVMVFTDANTCFAGNALLELVRPFGDERVGGVCGRLVFTHDNPFGARSEGTRNPAAEGAYWRWETRLKMLESRLDSCLGANGAIYAIRRSLFWQAIPSNTVIDDFVIGMKVREQRGRMLYVPEAVAYERLPAAEAEWSRRVRIGAGDYQALALCGKSLRLRIGWFAWSFWSHKVLRWFTPHLLAVAVAGAVVGVMTTACPGMRALHGVVVTGAAWGVLLLLLSRRGLVGGRVDKLVAHFVMMQMALMAGFVRYLRGGLRGSWERTPRG